MNKNNKQVVLVCLNCGRRWIGIDKPNNICKYSCLGPGVPTEIVVDTTMRTTNGMLDNIINK